MGPRAIARRKREYRRCRGLGDARPTCLVCGKSDPRLRYEKHHIVARFAGRRLCEVTVLLCGDCHDKASDMQLEFSPLDRGLNPQLVLRVNRARGQAILHELIAEQLRSEADELLALASLANDARETDQ